MHKRDGNPNNGRVLQMKAKAQQKSSQAEDPALTEALHQYQEGLRALQEHKYERAKALFQKLTDGSHKELADRAKVHLNSCLKNLERAGTEFKTPEEHYDYCISLLNIGDYVGARENLDTLQKQVSHADYVYYGLAVLNCLTGHFEDALRHLAESIRLNPSNRFQARNDSDFNNLADDPRFTELLYPENLEDSYPMSASGTRS